MLISAPATTASTSLVAAARLLEELHGEDPQAHR
jgi:hypothetical protein